MSKYIIELNEDCKIVQQMCVTEHGNAYTDGCYSCDLEELTSDYINEHYGELQDEAYQAGLNDAWEAARKLFSSMADSDIEKAFPIEWNNGGFKALMNLQPQEAIARLKAYEDKHSDRIEVGDEVISDTGTKFTVTGFANSDNACGISERGLWCFNTIDKLTKTGKHYDIASILEAMRK